MKRVYIVLTFLIVAIGIGWFMMAKNSEEGLFGIGYTDIKPVLTAVSATTTSSAIDITGARKATLSLVLANVTGTGLATSSFAVTVSADGKNYVTYNKLIDNLANSNAQNLTRVASKALDSNGTAIVSLDLEHDALKFMKVTSTITGTTTASVTATALIDY
jgi:hypothetical protein